MIFIQKMSITMGNFRTKVNFSNQIKEYANTEGTFSGSVYINQYTILGTDYSNLPLGLDNSTTGVTYFVSPIITDTFTGTTGSTTFYFSDSNMYLGTPYLSAITPSNTGITQNIFVTQPTYSTTVDGNNFDIYFSGVSYDLTATDIVEYSTGLYSGSLVTDFLLYISGTTYPWWFLKSGSTTWNEIKGRTKTDRLTITNSASTGYVLTCMDNEGNAAWQSFSSITGFTSGDCISDFYVSNLHGCSPITVWDQFQHTTCSATGQSSNSFGRYTYSYGDYSNSEGYNNYAIGNYSHVEGNYPDRDANRAIGNGSHAEGTETTANGNASHVEGDGSTANGIASHAEGLLTTSDGGGSHSEGHTTNSVGIASHSEGQLTIANGGYSHAEGYQSSTYGLYSHAEGNGTKTYAPYSHSEGQLNISGLVYLYTEYISGVTGYFYIDSIHGDVTSYFQNGDDLFISDINSNKNFLVSTYQYTVDGVSYQEISPSISGTVITVSPDPGFADDLGTNLFIGNLTIPLVSTISNSEIFDASHTEGSNNISFGLNSHAEGYYTISYGEASHSQGRTTKSIGDYSFASGLNTYADGNQTFIHSTNSHIKDSENSSILGGEENKIESTSPNNTIIGGSTNTITGSTNSLILGGYGNTINNNDRGIIINSFSDTIFNSNYTSIFNGVNNNISNSSNTTFLSSDDNNITNNSIRNIIIGDGSNTIDTSTYNSIIHGNSNYIQSSSYNNIYVGDNNSITDISTNNIIIKGDSNTILDNSTSVKIIGGNDNTINNTSLESPNSDEILITNSNNNNIDASTNISLINGDNNTITQGSRINIIGGNNNTINNVSQNNIIICGDSNVINGKNNVVILGLNSLTPIQNNTVYVPDLVIIPNNIPSTSGDTFGEVGSISWDDTHFYIKTNSGWGRINLDYGF